MSNGYLFAKIGRKEPENISEAEKICALAADVQKLLQKNITLEDRFRFDPVKIKLALQLVNCEIEKSI